MPRPKPDQLIIYQPRGGSPREFVDYWSALYQNSLEHLYTKNIGKPLTAARVKALYHWKNGGPLSEQMAWTVGENFSQYIDEVQGFPARMTAAEFLHNFPVGGATWRIFWGHCWQQKKFPLYDQFVDRAMMFIMDGVDEPPPVTEKLKIQTYLEDYLPFLERFKGISPLKVNRALGAYGKFLKTYPLPVW